MKQLMASIDNSVLYEILEAHPFYNYYYVLFYMSHCSVPVQDSSAANVLLVTLQLHDKDIDLASHLRYYAYALFSPQSRGLY